MPLEETPEGPEHPARPVRPGPARPPLASPRRRKGRWRRLRPRCLTARPPGNTARAAPVPAMKEEDEEEAVAWMDQALDVVSAGGGLRLGPIPGREGSVLPRGAASEEA